MKKSQIVIIILVAVVSAILIGTFTSANNSVTFDVAKDKPGKEFKISGTFDREHEVIFDPRIDPNLTVFFMKDKSGNSHEVHLKDKDGKPMGLEQSESVDLYGSFNDKGEFHASEILMKCPSKYNQNKHSLGDQPG